MDQWATILGAVFTVFGIMTAGCLLRRLNWLTEEADMSLLRLVIRLLVPCLAFSVVAGNPRLTEAGNLTLAPLVGFLTVAGGFGVLMLFAMLRARVTGLENLQQRRTFVLSNGVYNYGYVPVPLIALLFDDDTMGVLFVHNLGVEVAFWTLGVLILTGGWSRGAWKQVVNPPILAILFSIGINLMGWYEKVPQFVVQAAHMLGQSSIPLSLILVGAIAGDYLSEAARHLGFRLIGWSCVWRLGLLPAAFVLGAWWIPGSDELKRVMVIQAAMPAAMFPIVMAKHYGGDTSVAVRVAIGTSIVGFVTTPLWLTGGINWLSLAGS